MDGPLTCWLPHWARDSSWRARTRVAWLRVPQSLAKGWCPLTFGSVCLTACNAGESEDKGQWIINEYMAGSVG